MSFTVKILVWVLSVNHDWKMLYESMNVEMCRLICSALVQPLPSNELADIFSIRVDEPAAANQIAPSSQPGDPFKQSIKGAFFNVDRLFTKDKKSGHNKVCLTPKQKLLGLNP